MPHDAIESALLANNGALLSEITTPKPNGAPRQEPAPADSQVHCADSSADLARLAASVENFIRRFVVLPEAAYLPISVWTIATHAARRFDCFAYLALLSPAKRCGKTRLLEALEMLVYRPWRGTSPSPAALYRMMADSPTLLLDEVEALNSKNKSECAQAILAILNAGHRKGATIPRCDGSKHDLKHFPVFGPKAFAAIGRLPDTLLDRSIAISMQRRTKGQKVERFLAARAKAEAAPIRDGASRFAADYGVTIDQASRRLLDSDLEFLGDRDADLWIPMFAVCSVVAPGRIPDLRRCAISLSAAKSGDDADDSLPLTLLADIRKSWPVDEQRCDTANLISRLKALDAEFELTPRKMARMLRPFGVMSRTIRVGDRTPKGYYCADLEPAFSRYLEVQSATCATNQ
jgi:hypothetical protein